MLRNLEKRKELNREYNSRPEVRARRKERDRCNIVRSRELDAKRRQDPEFKRKKSEYSKKYRKQNHIKLRKNLAEWQRRNAPQQKEKRSIWSCTPRGRAVQLVNGARRRAKNMKIPFNIDIEFVQTAIETGVCPYTKQPFVLTKKRRDPWSPSLDRKNGVKGYTKDNVEITSLWWNTAKNEWSIEVMKQAVNGLTACDGF